jgi:putative alpha-1,2-mannosidase
VEWNGTPYTKSYITHQDMMQGGTLVFNLGPKPNPDFGQAEEDRPASVMYY